MTTLLKLSYLNRKPRFFYNRHNNDMNAQITIVDKPNISSKYRIGCKHLKTS